MMAVLGTVGPMIGLLGTLKGMIGSFSAIARGAARRSSPTRWPRVFPKPCC